MKFSEWKRLITSEESADRAEAADTLPENGTKSEISRLLLKCLDDRDSLVRTCALDTLRLFKSTAVAAKIKRHLGRERDPLARAYAARSLALIGRAEDLVAVGSLMTKEKRAVVRVNAAYGLLSTILQSAFSEILSCCNNKEEKTRMMAFALLDSIVQEANQEFQRARKTAIAQHLSDEPRSTKDHIANLLNIIPE